LIESEVAGWQNNRIYWRGQHCRIVRIRICRI